MGCGYEPRSYVPENLIFLASQADVPFHGVIGLSHYFAGIQRQVQILDDVIGDSLGESVNMNDLVSWFSFDCMGAFGFGQDLGMMKERKWLDAVVYMRSSWALLGVFTPAIWMPRIAFTLFPVWKVKEWLKALDFSGSLLEARLQASCLYA